MSKKSIPDTITQSNMPVFEGRVLNARPDTIDFRDNLYRASLIEVPIKRDLDDYRKHEVDILDQGTEGACTGFGLATVVHYLLRTRKVIPAKETTVSARMLYEMAKKYDEWEGEDYIGSSARGAMKGWHKHGVCEEKLWLHKPGKPDTELTRERSENAANIPLGAYYRVNHKDLIEMHSAIAEVGILYATARVHQGWYSIKTNGKSSGVIPYHGQRILGGHAFAIVAYDERGFWIQNSWGDKWGHEGFALVTYDDWLANGTDVWVARLGAPVTLLSANSIAKSYSVAASARDGFSFNDLHPHVVTLGNNGDLKATGTYGNTEEDIKRIFEKHIPAITKSWKKTRIMLYAHGGLVSEESVLQRLADYRQSLLAKEIYPIFFVWNSDIWSTITHMLKDALLKRKPEEKVGSVFDFMLDRLDDALEPLVRLPGKAAWNEMKENARAASLKNKGAFVTVKHLKKYLATKKNASLHLIGHSAGAIFHAPLINLLTSKTNNIDIKSCTLWAPACTTNEFKQVYLPAIKSKKIEKFALYTLTDEAEQDDNCARLYNKSLLYLVSNAFEEIPRGTSILGMESFILQDEELMQLFKDKLGVWVLSPNDHALPYASGAKRHGDFNDDMRCFESSVARILEADPYMQPGDITAAMHAIPPQGAEAGVKAGAVPPGGEMMESEKVPPGPSPDAPQVFMRQTKANYKERRNNINKLLFDNEG